MGKERQSKSSRKNFLLAATIGIFTLANSGIIGSVVGDERRREDEYLATHHYDTTLQIEMPNHLENLTFEELAELDKRVGAVYNQLDLKDWKIDSSSEYVHQWVEEVSDQIVAEGLADTIKQPSQLIFFHPSDSLEVNHVLGYSYCIDEVYLNYRMTSPATNWYESPLLLSTIVHEMIHLEAQGTRVCGAYDRDIVEATAQIGMLETLAGMANRGNKVAFKLFVYEYYRMVDTALLARAMKDRRINEYEDIKRRVEPDAFARAREAKIWMDWEGKNYQLEDIVQIYGFLPIDLILYAHVNGDDTVSGLALQPDTGTANFYIYSTNTRDRELKIDDWAYVSSHLEEMAREVGG